MEEQEPKGEAPLVLQLPKIDATLGSYRLVKLLGIGGMGRVYLAEHQKLGRRAALKLLHPEYSSNVEFVRRFFNEARAVNQINHPNIVEIVDFVEDPHGYNYFIMELLDGRDLRKARELDGPFLIDRAVEIGRQVASALAAAHDHGIVHRDIKPDNVLLLPREGKPHFIKLLDFGIAKLSLGVSQEDRTRLGLVLGTPGYMSPEQAFGRPIDGRADVYSLGVLLFWMLLDRLPSASYSPLEPMPEGEGPPEVLQTTARGQPIPEALAQLVQRCLRFSADDRVQTMAHVLDELTWLGPVVSGQPVPAAVAPPAPLQLREAIASAPEPPVAVKPDLALDVTDPSPAIRRGLDLSPEMRVDVTETSPPIRRGRELRPDMRVDVTEPSPPANGVRLQRFTSITTADAPFPKTKLSAAEPETTLRLPAPLPPPPQPKAAGVRSGGAGAAPAPAPRATPKSRTAPKPRSAREPRAAPAPAAAPEAHAAPEPRAARTSTGEMLAALQKPVGRLWLGVIAAAVVVAIGLLFVLGQDAPRPQIEGPSRRVTTPAPIPPRDPSPAPTAQLPPAGPPAPAPPPAAAPQPPTVRSPTHAHRTSRANERHGKSSGNRHPSGPPPSDTAVIDPLKDP